MLTAKTEIEDELKALNTGADEYVKKPFDPRILLIRAKKLLKTENMVAVGDIEIDMQGKKVFKNGLDLNITKEEFQLIQCLFENRGMILTRKQLLDMIWGLDYFGEERTVDTHIRRLREKVGEEVIKTHRGMGYSLIKNTKTIEEKYGVTILTENYNSNINDFNEKLKDDLASRGITLNKFWITEERLSKVNAGNRVNILYNKRILDPLEKLKDASKEIADLKFSKVKINTKDEIQDGLDDGSYLEIIEKQTEDISKLVDTLLFLSKYQNETVNKSSFNIEEVFFDTYEKYKINIKNRNIAVSIDMESLTDKIVFADKEKIIIVLNNFISNAIKYTSNNKIYVSFKNVNDRILFSIENEIRDYDPQQRREVTNLKKSQTEVSWDYPAENIGVDVKKVKDYLAVNIKSTKEGEIKWPHVSGDSYILPLWEGKYIPSDDANWKKFLNEQTLTLLEDFSMQFFAVNKEKYSVVYVMENMFNDEVQFDTKDKINFTLTHEFPSIH